MSAIVVSMTALSIAKVNQSAFAGSTSSRIAMQAQQHAAAEAEILKATKYENLAAHAKADIQNSDGYKSEITLSSESDYSDNIKQKIVTVKIFKDNEALPRATLKVPRLSVETEPAAGVPIGTVITWPSNQAPSEGGTWLECNGQSCSAYPELVAVLGKSTVPNYKGVFLRGYGSYTHNNVTHQSEALGQFQNMAFPETMNGIFYAVNTSGLAPSGPFKEIGNNKDLGLVDNGGFGDGTCKTVQFNFSSTVPTGNELRPVNIAVRYFIKAA